MTLPIPVAALSQHIIVLGKTRSGKSSKARVMVEHLLDQNKPVCIIDPKGDWWGLRSSADGKKSGHPVVIFGGEHADYPITEHSGAIVAEIVASGNRPAIIDLGGWMVGARTRFFIAFADAFFRHARGQRWLVIDECHNFAPQSQGRMADVETGKMLHWANRLASEGSGKGINLISASQRPQKVAKDYVTSHETLIACRAIHPRDLGAMEEWMAGYDPVRAKEVRASLPRMQRPDAWVWSPELDFGPKQITWPLFKTYDSFAAPTSHTVRKLKGWAAVDENVISERLAKVTEEAKANDPKALKLQIAELQKQLRDRPAETKTVTVTDDATIAKAEERAFERGKKEVAAAADREIKDARIKMLAELGERVGPLMSYLADELKGAKAAKPKIAATVAFTPTPVTSDRRPLSPARSPAAPKATRAAMKVDAGDGALPGNEQRVLNSLFTWKQLGHDRPSNAQVAWLAGYSPTSSSYTNPRGALKSKGYLDYPEGRLEITADGEPHAVPIDIGGGLLDFVLSKLPGNEARVLRAVAGAHPNAISNEDAAAGADYSPTSSSYTNPRGALKSKELITYPGGEVRAVDWLFT